MVWAERSPFGDAILAQWSAECEMPIAYRIRNGVLTAYGSPESVALCPDSLPEWAVRRRFASCARDLRRSAQRQAAADLAHAPLRAVRDVGRLALLLLVGRAGVDRAVEVVVRQFALDVLA